jgi:hypothetical protein
MVPDLNFEIKPKRIATIAGRHFLPFIAFGILIIGYSFYDLKNLDVNGLVVICKHALDLLSVSLFVWIVAGVGRLVLFHTRMLPDEPLDALLFSIAVGFGIIGNLILFIGLTATLHRFVIFFLFLFLLGIAAYQGRHLSNLMRGSLEMLIPPAGNLVISYFCLSIFALGAIFLLIFAMAPPVNWDSLMYHLHLPQSFIKENRLFLPADNLHAAFIGLAHMLYIPFLEIGNISGPALLSASIALMLGLSVFALTDRLFDRNAAYMSLAMLWGTATILLVAVTPRVDVTLSFFLLLAHHALLTALYSNSETRHHYFYLSAVFLGLSFGIKYGGLLYTACLSPLVVFVAFKNSHDLLNASKKILIFFFIIFVLMSPWLIKNWILFEAPLYPYIGRSAKYSAHAPPWIKNRTGSKPSGADARVKKFVKNKSGRVRVNLWDVLFNPRKVTSEGEGRYYYSNLLFLLLPLGMFVGRKKRLVWIVLPAVLFIAIIYFRFPRTNIRYFLPAIAPFTIAVGFIIHWICQRVKPRKISIIICILLITASLVLTARVVVRFVDKTKAVQHAFGLISSAKFMQTYKIGGIRNLSFMLDYVNKNLPADSVILMLFEARSFYFRPQTIQDIRNSSWPVLSEGLAADKCMHRLSVTHVLINQGTLNYYTTRGSKFSPASLKALHGFTDRCLELIHETRAHRLYKVKNE